MRFGYPLAVACERLQGSPNKLVLSLRVCPPQTSSRTDPSTWFGLSLKRATLLTHLGAHLLSVATHAGGGSGLDDAHLEPILPWDTKKSLAPCLWQQMPSFHGGTARVAKRNPGQERGPCPALGSACSLWAHAHALCRARVPDTQVKTPLAS